MNKRIAFIYVLVFVMGMCMSCKDDVSNTGQSVLGWDDEIIVLADTFSFSSRIDSCDAIISQADSFLLGEVETDYGLLRASILTQLACPEGFSYPDGFSIDSVDSVCLFLSYSSWVGDGMVPMAVNAYMMDRKTFRYSGTYPTDLNIDDYCSPEARENSILTNRRIVAAAEKLDSVRNNAGQYIPMVRMRVNDDFMRYFASIQSFESQETFNEQFKGLLIETSFGSSAVLNITDIALGVFYHFSYNKAGRDTTVSDMKAFYANSEVRTVNRLSYEDKQDWIATLQNDSDTYNYIVSPAGVYTRMSFPMGKISQVIESNMMMDSVFIKRPYVNKAEVRISVENANKGTDRNDWLSPADYMLLVKENSMERFFRNNELPSDTCALLCALTQGTDSLGDPVYYYTYDLSDFLTNQLRHETKDSILNMLLVPVSVQNTTTTNSTTAVSAVRQQQTISATKIRSAQNGLQLEIVYSGF